MEYLCMESDPKKIQLAIVRIGIIIGKNDPFAPAFHTYEELSKYLQQKYGYTPPKGEDFHIVEHELRKRIAKKAFDDSMQVVN